MNIIQNKLIKIVGLMKLNNNKIKRIKNARTQPKRPSSIDINRNEFQINE